jgi:sec-independent protein translocase protein TatA
MPGFGSAHWPYIIILLVIVLIIWGPGKLPDLGAGMGRAIREFRKASSDVRDQVVNATSSEPEPQHPVEAGTAPTAKPEASEEQPKSA